MSGEPKKDPLADSKEEIEVMDAQARLKKAEAELAAANAKLAEAETERAKTQLPIWDKVVLRGLIPIALAIVGPWALWYFDTKQNDTKVEIEKQQKALEDQAAVTKKLHVLLDRAESYSKSTEARRRTWQSRMQEVETQKAAELAALAGMVKALDRALKMTLIRFAIERVASEEISFKADKTGVRRPAPAALKKARGAIERRVMIQAQWQGDPGDDPEQVQERKLKMVREAMDRYIQEQQQKQR